MEQLGVDSLKIISDCLSQMTIDVCLLGCVLESHPFFNGICLSSNIKKWFNIQRKKHLLQIYPRK